MSMAADPKTMTDGAGNAAATAAGGVLLVGDVAVEGDRVDGEEVGEAET
jgi:hypothetical protein